MAGGGVNPGRALGWRLAGHKAVGVGTEDNAGCSREAELAAAVGYYGGREGNREVEADGFLGFWLNQNILDLGFRVRVSESRPA